MDQLAQWALENPQVGLIVGVILLQAAAASRIIDIAKALLRNAGKDIGPAIAKYLCVAASVGLAYLELKGQAFPWFVWVIGIGAAIVTGPWFHNVTKAGREVTK